MIEFLPADPDATLLLALSGPWRVWVVTLGGERMVVLTALGVRLGAWPLSGRGRPS